MDHSPVRWKIKRIREETAEHIRKGRESCADSTEHVSKSRAAVARSLELLRDTPVGRR